MGGFFYLPQRKEKRSLTQRVWWMLFSQQCLLKGTLRKNRMKWIDMLDMLDRLDILDTGYWILDVGLAFVKLRAFVP
jgi:hypothetical protein